MTDDDVDQTEDQTEQVEAVQPLTGLGITVDLRQEDADAECDLAGILDTIRGGGRSGPVFDGAGVKVGMWTVTSR